MTEPLPEVPSPDAAFLSYWREHLVDPHDPQRDRWLALERDQVRRNRAIAAEVSRFARLDGARVLDVGCQAGALPVALAERGAEVTGVDVDAALLEGARLRAEGHGVRATFCVARAEALPFDDARFDAVTFVDVIEHVDDARRAVAELARVLRPGGVLYLFGPNRFAPANLRRDPHYQLAGVSAMPTWLGRWYVTRVRGFPRYEVGVLPVGSVVRGWLRDEGFTVIDSPEHEALRWCDARAPGVGAARDVARWWGRARTSVAPEFRLVATRDGR